LFDDGAVLGGAGDGDAAAAAEVEEAFVAELAEGAQDGVGVDAENGGEVSGGWQSFAGFGFAVGDGAADLASDLIVQVEGVVAVELDIAHGASHYSFIRDEIVTVTTPPRGPEIERDRDLERVADLEALIEEARRRARRRRQRNGAAALLVTAAGVAAFIGFGGHGGGGAGTAARAHAPGSQGSTAKAESPPLAALPPDAGTAKAIAFDPRNPEIVYVLTVGYSHGPARSHVFKTTDGGAHWQATATSGSDWVGGNEALTADPRHPGTLYAGTEVAVYRTVDGGRSWRASNRGLFAPPRPTYQFNRDKGWVIALAVDPANTNIVYAGSDRVSKSTDGGHSWKTMFPSHPTRYPRDRVSALAIAPTRPEAIYAITGDFSNGRTSIYKSTDAGTTWRATTSVRGTDNGAGFDTALAVDPRHPSTIYAALLANVLKTTNGGKTWQPIDGLPIGAGLYRAGCSCQGGVTALAVDPRRTGTVYAATNGGIYKTTNGGQTWTRANNLPYMYTIAVDPARPATIYAAAENEPGHGPRILKSTNSGHTWTTAP
jgi:photosystem II stability/assembly factor-like uncharacterized protein